MQFIRLVEEMMPRTIMMENVPSLIETEIGSGIFKITKQHLLKLGYKLAYDKEKQAELDTYIRRKMDKFQSECTKKLITSMVQALPQDLPQALFETSPIETWWRESLTAAKSVWESSEKAPVLLLAITYEVYKHR